MRITSLFFAAGFSIFAGSGNAITELQQQRCSLDSRYAEAVALMRVGAGYDLLEMLRECGESETCQRMAVIVYGVGVPFGASPEEFAEQIREATLQLCFERLL